MKVVVGIGGSGSQCVAFVKQVIQEIKHLSDVQILGASPIYENPASGGVTVANFANAALLLTTSQSLEVLWQHLHLLERRQGRIRLIKNGPRTVDLDLLWADQKPTQPWLRVPHPRFLERDFALIPALDAFKMAGLVAPLGWKASARALQGLSHLRAIS
jgi:2-amino-4-hydroxy-6-hydroxymethyldihydropteridine diphosphokinase